MYQKPVVERFGSFRNLTQSGGTVFGGDAWSLYSPAAPSTPVPPVSVQVSRS